MELALIKYGTSETIVKKGNEDIFKCSILVFCFYLFLTEREKHKWGRGGLEQQRKKQTPR